MFRLVGREYRWLEPAFLQHGPAGANKKTPGPARLC